MVRKIYEVGGKGHSCGIYSHDDAHIDRLARIAPVSRMMVRQPQSKANAGSFTNGMPMTSSLGCGIWGGNITNENIHLKHFMQTTWVSRPIPEDRPSDQELFGEFYNTETPLMRATVAEHLVRYLERRGVRHVFGLCGHTNIAVLSAMANSGIEFINVRHEQVAAHAADGYARVTRKASVLLTHLGPGLTNAATGVANAALDCIPMVVIAGDVPSHYFGKHPHQEVNLHADGAQYEIYRPFVKRAWRVDDPKLFAEIIDKAFLLAESGQPGPVLVDVPMDVFSAEVDSTLFTRLDSNTRELRKPSLDAATAREIVTKMAEARQPVLYVGGGIVLADACEELRALRRSPGNSGRPQSDGQGRPARRSPLVARHERLLGHEARERHLPGRGLGARPRHALQGSRLQLLVSKLHVQHSADAPHPHRHRACRDRSKLSDRTRRGGRSQTGAHRPDAGRARAVPGGAQAWPRSPARSQRRAATSPPATRPWPPRKHFP